jgi:DivIVA domain-containing protein
VVTLFLYSLALLVVGGLLFLLASFVFGRGEELAPMPPDVSPVVLPPARRVTGRDLHRLRLPVVLRGYRMSEVGWVLDRLAREIDERDWEIARLRQEYEGAAEQPEPATGAAGGTGATGPEGAGGPGEPGDGTDRDGPTGQDPALRAAQPAEAGEGARGWQAP